MQHLANTDATAVSRVTVDTPNGVVDSTTIEDYQTDRIDSLFDQFNDQDSLSQQDPNDQQDSLSQQDPSLCASEAQRSNDCNPSDVFLHENDILPAVTVDTSNAGDQSTGLITQIWRILKQNEEKLDTIGRMLEQVAAVTNTLLAQRADRRGQKRDAGDIQYDDDDGCEDQEEAILGAPGPMKDKLRRFNTAASPSSVLVSHYPHEQANNDETFDHDPPTQAASSSHTTPSSWEELLGSFTFSKDRFHVLNKGLKVKLLRVPIIRKPISKLLCSNTEPSIFGTCSFPLSQTQEVTIFNNVFQSCFQNRFNFNKYDYYAQLGGSWYLLISPKKKKNTNDVVDQKFNVIVIDGTVTVEVKDLGSHDNKEKYESCGEPSFTAK